MEGAIPARVTGENTGNSVRPAGRPRWGSKPERGEPDFAEARCEAREPGPKDRRSPLRGTPKQARARLAGWGRSRVDCGRIGNAGRALRQPTGFRFQRRARGAISSSGD